ncbi:MAG: SCP-2 sterol transfer family protein [Gammaproteobacteria bacterium]|nr:SCP-2 sterol transfer family protein [Gammaproteobacteria bacterium]MBU1653523.1 SCP-2 sterol transfer family protein [Gammaproteobacteria bacterium]MBU1962552.1 SCP-2 sterol transfer family protein [Gammaproteobacteria bacterium]
MSELFSQEWMQGFQAKWNGEPTLSGELEQIGFNSVIGYGFPGEDAPRGVLGVTNGKAVAAGSYSGEALNWDIRCSQEQWEKMMSDPPGMMGLGLAFTSGKMKFVVGDYGAMIKDPRIAGPFVKSFAVMAQV